MDYVVTVDIESRDCAQLVDACREGALESACARAGSVERRDDADGSAYEAVRHIAGVLNKSRNPPLLVDAVSNCRPSALEESCAPAGSVERSDAAIRSTHEAVYDQVIVKDYSRNRPRRV